MAVATGPSDVAVCKSHPLLKPQPHTSAQQQIVPCLPCPCCCAKPDKARPLAPPWGPPCSTHRSTRAHAVQHPSSIERWPALPRVSPTLLLHHLLHLLLRDAVCATRRGREGGPDLGQLHVQAAELGQADAARVVAVVQPDHLQRQQ